MKISLLFILLACTFSVFAQADFTGKWKLNVDKSQFNNTPGMPAAPRLLVEQKANKITFQRNDRAKEQIEVDSDKSIEIAEGENKTRVSMRSTYDKKGLVETRIYAYPKTETAEVAARKTRTWRLSDDKKVLIIRDEIESTAGQAYEMLLVYDRQ